MLLCRSRQTVLVLSAVAWVLWSASLQGASPKKLAGEGNRPSHTTTADNPQTPKPPFPYGQREVSYNNSADNVTLAGTLTVPAGKGPHPAVLLLPGSGPVDRNETMLPGHKPFLVIADYLTRRGVAVLRVDDRSVGGSKGDYMKSTCENFAGDALAAIDFLRKQPDVDKNRIGIVGHSQGAIVAPMAAVQSSDVSFIVMLAAPVLPDRLNSRLRLAANLEAKGASEEEIRRQLDLNRTFHDRLTEGADDASLRPLLRDMIKAGWPAGAPLSQERLDDLVQGQLPRLHTRYVRFLIEHDPREVLRRVRVPVLAINGSFDIAAPARENLGALRKIMQESGNGAATIIELYGVNHLMQTANSTNPLESLKIKETFSPKVLQLMNAWIRLQTGLSQ